ncbi:MAG: flavin reductase family protein [Alphaproteobacteria bacterium]
MLGHFTTGITVATCRRKDGSPAGVTINSFTSVSLNPALILFCLGHATRVYGDFIAAEQFAISILAEPQEPLARHFSGPNADDWSRIGVPAQSGDGPPVLADSLGWLSCRRHAIHPGGDHAIIVGRVTALGQPHEADPLLYFRSQYRRL